MCKHAIFSAILTAALGAITPSVEAQVYVQGQGFVHSPYNGQRYYGPVYQSPPTQTVTPSYVPYQTTTPTYTPYRIVTPSYTPFRTVTPSYAPYQNSGYFVPRYYRRY